MHFDRSDWIVLAKSLSPIKLFKRFVVWAMDFYSHDDGEVIWKMGVIFSIAFTFATLMVSRNLLVVLSYPLWFVITVLLITLFVVIPKKLWELAEDRVSKWKRSLALLRDKWHNELLDEKYKNYKPKPKNDD